MWPTRKLYPKRRGDCDSHQSLQGEKGFICVRLPPPLARTAAYADAEGDQFGDFSGNGVERISICVRLPPSSSLRMLRVIGLVTSAGMELKGFRWEFLDQI
ncbi:hypothetical protein TIFTF001_016476 [Ficus carica]|uniref:Uncharacterized protein n=1 Tax=Ficus carica TaxID=3494 RepID=A0AA88A6D2_FICCA|nr:hypothetical protein TIFTF001_016476 [Ficus carica]